MSISTKFTPDIRSCYRDSLYTLAIDIKCYTIVLFLSLFLAIVVKMCFYQCKLTISYIY